MLAPRRLLTLLRELVTEFVRPGESRLSGRELSGVARFSVTLVIVVTNVIGALAVVVIALFVVPVPKLANAGHVRLLSALLGAGYAVAALLAGVWIGTREVGSQRAWLVEERAATFEETRLVLRAPMILFGLQYLLWFAAAILFGVVDGLSSAQLGLRVAIAVATTGLVTASLAYLLTELSLRPIAARALARGAPERLVVPGVATRLVLTWVLGTGVQLFGIAAIGVLALAHDASLTRRPLHGVDQLGITMVVLGGTGVLVGLLAVIVVARTTADPIDSVRRALAEVQRGRFDVRVKVYDGTQIGQLQLGFNEMAGGLQERERIREAFGAYVDPDVARRVLEEGIDLAGEEVEVTIMFLDIRGFTGFAERVDAEHAVAAINELFAQAVPVVHDHGGRVDTFIGDGLMAVFGAPRRQPDHARQGLHAAIEITRRARSTAGLSFGIGLNSGRVVAGNVGGAGRVEFSVIGDPVNVAARIEAATRATGDAILVAERTVELLGERDRAGLELVERPDVALKGKTAEVRLYAPVLPDDEDPDHDDRGSAHDPDPDPDHDGSDSDSPGRREAAPG